MGYAHGGRGSTIQVYRSHGKGEAGWSHSLSWLATGLPAHLLSWVSCQRPPNLWNNPTLLPSSIHDVWRDPLNKWASVLNTLIQRLSFLSSNPVTGITQQHCDVLFFNEVPFLTDKMLPCLAPKSIKYVKVCIPCCGIFLRRSGLVKHHWFLDLTWKPLLGGR